MLNTNNYSLDNSYYVLDNGRIWDIDKAKFVAELPADALWRKPLSATGTANEESLEMYLREDGHPLGEFKKDADFAAEVRAKRNALIAETDYMAMPDYPLPEEKRQAMLAYRQALRDVPEQVGFPRQIDWPEKP